MADFTLNSNVKTAVRNLAAPIADVTAFNGIVQSVILNNPFGCVSYMSSGASHPPIEKVRETYTAKFVYQDGEAKRVGSGSESYNSMAGFNAGITAVLANSANVSAHGGSIAHDIEGDTYSATLRCHAPNGEMYYVTVARQKVTVSSFSDDAIQSVIETWADSVPALA